MIKTILAALCLMGWMSFANAASVKHPHSVDSDAQANLVVFRPRQPVMLNGTGYQVYVDDIYLGRLKSEARFILRLAPGQHSVRVNDSQQSRFLLQVVEGKTHHLRGLYQERPQRGVSWSLVAGE